MTEAMQADWIAFLESKEGGYAVKKWKDDLRHMCWAFHLWMDVKNDGEVLALKERIAELERLSESQAEALDMMDRGVKL